MRRRGKENATPRHAYRGDEEDEAEQRAAIRNQSREVTYDGFEGRLLDQAGGRFTYQFRLKTSWEIADNARINVKNLDQTREVGARVVSQEATTLLLVTEEVPPSAMLAHLLLVEDTTWLLKKLRQALAYLQETAGQLGAKTLGLVPFQRDIEPITERLCKFEPHPHQRQAIEQALSSEVTLIVGPPGTGKTTTLCEIMCRFLRQGRSVLLVSHTNIATDNAFLRLVQAIEQSQQDDPCAFLDQGRVVRAGEPRHIALREGAYHDLTVNALAEARVGEIIQECSELEQRQQALEQQMKQAQIDLDAYTKEWQVRRKRLLNQCEALQQAAQDWAFLTEQAEIRTKAQQELTRLCSEYAHAREVLDPDLSTKKGSLIVSCLMSFSPGRMKRRSPTSSPCAKANHRLPEGIKIFRATCGQP